MDALLDTIHVASVDDIHITYGDDDHVDYHDHEYYAGDGPDHMKRSTCQFLRWP